MSIVRPSSKLYTGIAAIFLGKFGLHKFMIGATNAGIVTLGLTIGGWLLAPFTHGLTAIFPVLMLILGIIEGIIYLTRTDAEFYGIYRCGHKPWL